MRRLCCPAAPGRVAATRVVLLPGAYQEPEEFIRAGFVEAVRARALDWDLEFIAPELEHVLDRRILDQLPAEVLGPARAAGVRRLWLGGASLGGFIALACAERHATALDGLLLIAPYLGHRGITGPIERAGGLAHWQPPASPDEEQRVWQSLREGRPAGVELVLGIGRADRFNASHRLLAAALPDTATLYADGGHDWPTWRRLWEAFLERGGHRADATAPLC